MMDREKKTFEGEMLRLSCQHWIDLVSRFFPFPSICPFKSVEEVIFVLKHFQHRIYSDLFHAIPSLGENTRKFDAT